MLRVMIRETMQWTLLLLPLQHRQDKLPSDCVARLLLPAKTTKAGISTVTIRKNNAMKTRDTISTSPGQTLKVLCSPSLCCLQRNKQTQAFQEFRYKNNGVNTAKAVSPLPGQTPEVLCCPLICCLRRNKRHNWVYDTQKIMQWTWENDRNKHSHLNSPDIMVGNVCCKL